MKGSHVTILATKMLEAIEVDPDFSEASIADRVVILRTAAHALEEGIMVQGLVHGIAVALNSTGKG